jgi:hypothetical protein
MKMTDMRAKARAIFGPAIAEPMPNQPNGAKALQERANARPIPTYKVGGSVKKDRPPQPTAAEREADRKRREEYAKMKVTPENAAAIGRGNRSSGYNSGGKVMPKNISKSSKSPPTSDEMERRYDMERRKMLNEASKAGLGRGSGYKMGGKVQTSADTAKKLATEMGGMKKGGKPKDGLAVMIAIGSPKKPVKKMGGGMMNDRAAPADVVASRMAAGGAGKTRKGQAPVKLAQGGAGKVRKGMMTPEGVITHAMNKMRGK